MLFNHKCHRERQQPERNGDMTNTITTAKEASKNFEDVRDFIKWDEDYQNARQNNGQAQGRNAYSVEDMLADMVRVARALKTPLDKLTGKQYQNAKGAFSRPGFEKRFGTWGQARNYAVQAVELGLIDRYGKCSGKAILKDMRQVALNMNVNVLALEQKNYDKHGNYSMRTVRRYFGSWNDAINQAFDLFVNHDWDDIR
mgnify:FL=1